MNYKFHLSVLTGAIMIAVLVTLVAPMYTGAVGPTANPPDNDGLVPTFSGLRVIDNLNATGTSTFDVVNIVGDATLQSNASVAGDLTLSGSTPTINTYCVPNNNPMMPPCTPTPLNINANLHSGSFSTNGEIRGEGNFYLAGHLLSELANGIINFGGTGNATSINVKGRITTDDQVGSYYRAYKQVNAPTNTAISHCFAGDRLVGCSGYNTGGFRGAVPYYGVDGIDYCYAYSNGVATLTSYSICFDPQGSSNRTTTVQ